MQFDSSNPHVTNSYEQPLCANPVFNEAYTQPAPLIDQYKDHAEERVGFMQKLYGIVTLQLFITFIMALLASYVEIIGRFFNHPAVFIVGFIGMIVFLLFTFCAKNRVPLNYITLFGFTLCMSTMVSGIAAFMRAEDVFRAILLTLIISISLTIATFAMGERMMMWVLFVIVIAVSFFYFTLFFFIFTGSDVAYSICVSIVGLIYGCYLILDTFIIKSFADVDDYIIAAVMIYIDIIRIFIFVLSMLGRRSGS